MEQQLQSFRITRKFSIKMQNRIIIHASSEENNTIEVDVTKLQYFTTILNLGFDDALQEHIFADVCTRNIDINVPQPFYCSFLTIQYLYFYSYIMS